MLQAVSTEQIKNKFSTEDYQLMEESLKFCMEQGINYSECHSLLQTVRAMRRHAELNNVVPFRKTQAADPRAIWFVINGEIDRMDNQRGAREETEADFAEAFAEHDDIPKSLYGELVAAEASIARELGWE